MNIMYVLYKIVTWLFGFILYLTWPMLFGGVIMLLRSFIDWDMENNFYWFVEFVRNGANTEIRFIYLLLEFVVGVGILGSRQFDR